MRVRFAKNGQVILSTNKLMWFFGFDFHFDLIIIISKIDEKRLHLPSMTSVTNLGDNFVEFIQVQQSVVGEERHLGREFGSKTRNLCLGRQKMATTSILIIEGLV